MQIDGLNRWLTIVANVGVVVGIAFLVVEIRQNTIALSAEAYQSRSEALQEMSMFIAGSEVLATIDANLIKRPDSCGEFERNCEVIDDEYLESLSVTERQQYKRFLQAQNARVQNLVFQYEQGLLSEAYHDRVIISVIEYYMPLWERFDIYQRENMAIHLENYRNH